MTKSPYIELRGFQRAGSCPISAQDKKVPLASGVATAAHTTSFIGTAAFDLLLRPGTQVFYRLSPKL
jgi:hypothetical protein